LLPRVALQGAFMLSGNTVVLFYTTYSTANCNCIESD